MTFHVKNPFDLGSNTSTPIDQPNPTPGWIDLGPSQDPWETNPLFNTTYPSYIDNINDNISAALAYTKFLLEQIAAQQQITDQRAIFIAGTWAADAVANLLSAQTKSLAAEYFGYSPSWTQQEILNWLAYIASQWAAENETKPENEDKEDQFYEKLARVAGTGWLGLRAIEIGAATKGTLRAGLAATKILDPFITKFAPVSPALFPILGFIQTLRKYQIRLSGITFTRGSVTVATDNYEQLDHTDYYDDPVVPVAIQTPSARITATATRQTQTIAIDLTSTRTPTKEQENKLYGDISSVIRPYPMARAISPAIFPATLENPIPQINWKETIYLGPAKWAITFPKYGTIAISRSKTSAKTATWEETKLRFDKKSYASYQYMAMSRMMTRSWGTVTNLLDLKDAFFTATKVKYGGFWWTLSSLSPAAQRRAIDDMRSGNAKYVTNWSQVARTLLVNEFIDYQVGLTAKLESHALQEMGLLSSFGKPTTWISRSN